MSWSHCHTSVTSDDMITVIATSHKIIEKDIEGSGRMMLYNIYNIWLFNVKIVDGGLYFIFSLSLLFYFSFLFLFPFLFIFYF